MLLNFKVNRPPFKGGNKSIIYLKKPFSPYNKKLKGISKTLRKNSTLSEVLLWNEIKGGKIMDYKFNRQKPIKNYVVGFLLQEIEFCDRN